MTCAVVVHILVDWIGSSQCFGNLNEPKVFQTKDLAVQNPLFPQTAAVCVHVCEYIRVYEMTTVGFIATNKVHHQNINNPNHNLDGRKNLANMSSLSTVFAEKSAFSFHFSYNILWLQGYNALKDYFPTMEMRPNPQCSNSACMERQVLRFRYNPLVHLLKQLFSYISWDRSQTNMEWTRTGKCVVTNLWSDFLILQKTPIIKQWKKENSEPTNIQYLQLHRNHKPMHLGAETRPSWTVSVFEWKFPVNNSGFGWYIVNQ